MPEADDLRRFFAAVPAIIFRLNADWSRLDYLFGNAVLANALTPTDAWLAAYVPVPQPAQLRRWVARAVQTQEVFDHAFPVFQANGAVGRVRARVVPLRNVHGVLTAWLGTAQSLAPAARSVGEMLPSHALFVAVQEAEEAERKRIAEGLHNGICQMLYAVKLRLERSRELLPNANATVNALLQETNELLADAIRQVRSLSHELVPLALEEFGLEAALLALCRKMSRLPLRLYCRVHLDESLPPVPDSLQVALYRIAQELTQNIAKHATGATHAGLDLEHMPGFVLLRVEDNGPGFAPVAPAIRGLGLRSIRDRVALLGGAIEVSPPGHTGAYVRIRLPLPVA